MFSNYEKYHLYEYVDKKGTCYTKIETKYIKCNGNTNEGIYTNKYK